MHRCSPCGCTAKLKKSAYDCVCAFGRLWNVLQTYTLIFEMSL